MTDPSKMVEMFGTRTLVSDDVRALPDCESLLIGHVIEQANRQGFVALPESGRVEFIERDDPRWLVEPMLPEGASEARVTIEVVRGHDTPVTHP